MSESTARKIRLVSFFLVIVTYIVYKVMTVQANIFTNIQLNTALLNILNIELFILSLLIAMPIHDNERSTLTKVIFWLLILIFVVFEVLIFVNFLGLSQIAFVADLAPILFNDWLLLSGIILGLICGFISK